MLRTNVVMFDTKWMDPLEVDVLMTSWQDEWSLWNDSSWSYSDVAMSKAVLSRISQQVNGIEAVCEHIVKA